MIRRAIPLLVLAGASCTSHEFVIPAPASPPPAAATAQLHAGFARVDITPPPGGGLMGYATEGKRSRGHRMRLYARAMVLEDEGGERLAFVVADLGSVSPLLHRLAAQRTAARAGIGADRLILTATHTHSAPGHYYAAPAYDEQASTVQGFDSVHAVFVAERIAESVLRAAETKRPARAVWGFTNVWGLTRVRDYAMTERNRQRFEHPALEGANLPDDPRFRYVDPQWSMLRVDAVNAAGEYEPIGTFSVFQIHGTLNPGANQLIDGDVHSIVARELERRIGRPADRPDVQPQTIHLMANGASGDVTAAVSDVTRCPAPTYGHAFIATGPRTPLAGADSVLPAFPPYPECLSLSRADAVRIGNTIADAAHALHASLDGAIHGDSTAHLRLARTFGVVDVTGDGALTGLCMPHAGPNTIPGPEGSHTRLVNVAFLRNALAMDTLPVSPGAEARDRCQGAKPPMGVFERVVGGPEPYPLQLQFTVARVGPVTIGTVPAEPTTNAGWLMRRMMADDATDPYHRSLLLSLTNGYAQYVTTIAEYDAQMYEGASTLYGPRTAEAFGQQLRALVERLPAAGRPSPADTIPDVRGNYRSNRERVPRRSALAVQSFPARSVETCFRGDTLIATWTDQRPGDLQPADGALLRIDRQLGSDRTDIVTWDDDPYLEIWYVGEREDRHTWQVRYAPPNFTDTPHRIVLLGRTGVAQHSGNWIRPGTQCR